MRARFGWFVLSVALAGFAPAWSEARGCIQGMSGRVGAVVAMTPGLALGQGRSCGPAVAEAQSVEVPGDQGPASREAAEHDENEEEQEATSLGGKALQFGIAFAFLLGMVTVLFVLRRS